MNTTWPADRDRLPPHSIEAEQGVLGCVFLSPAECLGSCIERFKSGAEVFYDLRHRQIYELLVQMYDRKEAVDLLTVQQRLKDANQLDAVGGLAYLASLPDAVPSAANLSYYTEILEEKRRLRELAAVASRALSLAYGGGGQDADAMLDRIVDTASAIRQSRRSHQSLTLRRPDVILEMKFDDSDVVLSGGLVALGQGLVIAGQGGCGKSRIVLQAIASIVSGKKFLHFETRGKTLKWLLLQTENSNRRLQKDLLWLKLWMGGDSWGRFCEQVRIHTIETDRDGLVSLDSPQNQAAIRTAIESDKFDGIVIDPLSHFMIGDPNKDFEMMMFLQVLSRICRHGNPNRALIVVHHAIVGRGGAVKATGYDRGSFGRGSKALFGWARAQINLAPVDAHSNDRLVVACGKNSNGREFQPFAIRLNPDTMIYECDPSVDVAGWARDMSGAAERGPAMDATRVAELCKPATPRQELAKLIMADCGCSKATAYRQIRQANGKTIRCDKNDVFSPASHENLMRQDAESLTSHTPCKGVRRDAQPRETDDQTNRSLECREVEV